jgi:hypothetical protein
MRIELNDGEMLELSDGEARDLYEALRELARERGAISAAGKLRYAITWSSGYRTKIALNRNETAAVIAVREKEISG